jgi:hypothetical protein
MAKLSDDILNTIFTLQRRLVEILNETTATEYIFMQQFGETEATLPELESLDNIKERLRTSYNRLYRLLQQVAESQPAATADTLNFLYGTIEDGEAIVDASAASIQEIKMDWNLR